MLKNLVFLGRFLKTLTREQAEQRSKMVKKQTISYSFYLSLHKGNSYDGLANISFTTQDLSKSPLDNLRIDFQGKEVKGILINNKLVSKPQQSHNNGTISIPTKYLNNQAQNNVSIIYQNEYDKDGNGCVSFVDVDTKQYLYTQFQPYFANKVFPLFDQPDLKARMSLDLATPSDWQAVLSNQFPVEGKITDKNIRLFKVFENTFSKYIIEYSTFVIGYSEKIPNKYKITSFNQTALLPTYLYCFVVGPYKQLVLKSTETKVPMRLYSIQSLYPQLLNLAPYIQEITVKSLLYFEKYFGYKYPFSKYDQIFAHEYKWGAMQNAGIVTFNDLYLFKDKVSTQRLLGFGNTIVHELSHHWFGNLVTMKWWDDLWLNESFAEYISHFCLDKIKHGLTTIEFESAMISFFNRKSWGYAEDQMVTTHPIRSQVENTFTAESIFDGITYSKGAAVMKQLMYLIGQQKFSAALKAYFKKYEFKNAVLDDLLRQITPYFDALEGINLKMEQWKKMWLETPGTNILKSEWQSGSKQLTIKQGFDREQCNFYRLHRIKIGIIVEANKVIEQQVLVLPQEKTTVTLKTEEKPLAILLNYQDLTFAKLEFDNSSMQYFNKNLSKIEDSLSRALIWKTFYNMIKDAKIKSTFYCEFVINNLVNQTSDVIFEEQLSYLSSAVSSYTPKAFREQLYDKIFEFLIHSVVNLPQQSDHNNRRVILCEKMIDSAHSEKFIQKIIDWHNGTHSQLKTQNLNVTLKWKIVVKAFFSKSLSKNDKWKLFNEMKSVDSSDTMVNRKFVCEALVAEEGQLEKIYQNYFNSEKEISNTNLIFQMRGFNSQPQSKAIRHAYFEKYFKDAQKYLSEEVSETERWFIDGDFLQSFIVYMDPLVEDSKEELIRKIESFSSLKVKNNDKLRRIIMKKIDLLQRRSRAYSQFD